MILLSEIIVFLMVCGLVFCTDPATVFEAKGKYQMEIGENVVFKFYGVSGSSAVLNAEHKSSVFKTNGSFKRCVLGKNELDICLNWGLHVMNVSVVSENCLQVEASQPGGNGELSVCFSYDDANWFGGPSLYNQSWPVQFVKIENTPFLTGYKSGQRIVEPFWFNSEGISIHVSLDVPLFWESNQNSEKKLCLIARDTQPYIPRNVNILRYEICTAKNSVEIQRAAMNRYFQKPTVMTNALTFQDVSYGTSVRYGQNFDQNTLSQLLTEIQLHNYPIGNWIIEDNWESCYGTLDADTTRFPTLLEFTRKIHSLGGKISAWAFPYISEDCQQLYEESLSNNRFVRGEETINIPWGGGNSGVIDFSKNEVVEWWERLFRSARNRYELNSFKFDFGESCFLPSLPQLTGNEDNSPDFFIKKYIEATTVVAGLHQVSFGRNTQNVSVLVRMSDKDSRWGLDNGLQSVLTTLFQMNLAGYPFVIADYVGGNQRGAISKELFIRWLQAVTFMPVIQFSVVPWDFDIETVEISRELLALHNSYTNLIQSAAEKALSDGTPINTPIWWIAPDDPIALNCTDEYLLAGSVLVAPILQEGVYVRDVYLPQGTWYNSKVGTIEGPTTVRVQAPLNTLPYFVKDDLKIVKS